MTQVFDTYGINGIPPPSTVKILTNTIPYAPGMPLRGEISVLAASKDPKMRKQWTLFVLALEKFKAIPIADKLSYFQVAGIHGYPETAWDSAPAPKQDPVDPGPGDDPYGGYCAHNDITFPTWHRPYMVLYEQRIWEIMVQIITKDWNLTGTELDTWKDAADTWRLPYWDWASKQDYCYDFGLPLIFTNPTVRIWPPQSVVSKYPTPKSYLNPFWGFDNPETDEDGNPLPLGQMPAGLEKYNIKDDILKKGATGVSPNVLPWSKTTGVGRYGIFISRHAEGPMYIGLNSINNASAVNSAFAAANYRKFWYNPNKDRKHGTTRAPHIGTIGDSVSRLFSHEYADTWGLFATTKWYAEHRNDKDISPTAYMSLEFIHNNVHNETGGAGFDLGLGHMSDVPVAAFDPIFWLHHCNIDRLLAMWQALHWQRWWDKPEPPAEGADPRNVPDKLPTDFLQPFHTKTGGDPAVDVWTSDKVRDWTKLGYQYDTLVPQPNAILADGTLNEDQYMLDLRAYINKQYPHTGHLVKHVRDTDKINTPKGLLKSDSDGLVWTDYIINVVYDRYALDGRSYAIKFYLGKTRADEDDAFTDTNYIGQVFTFSGGGSRQGCQNCKTQAGAKVLSRAQIPFTIQLLHQAIEEDNKVHPIQSFEKDKVGAYLEEYLQWKFVALGGADQDASKFPDTLVSVWRGTGEPGVATDDGKGSPPQYKGYKPVHRATDGKVHGLGKNDPELGEQAFPEEDP